MWPVAVVNHLRRALIAVAQLLGPARFVVAAAVAEAPEPGGVVVPMRTPDPARLGDVGEGRAVVPAAGGPALGTTLASVYRFPTPSERSA